MYKKLRLLTTMLLLAVCCGTWAEEVAFTFATSKSSSNTAYATNYDITVNGMAWSCPGNQNFSGYVRIGGKSISTDVDRDIYSKVAMSDAISKITFNHNGISNKNLKVNKITLTVASDASFNNVVDTKVITPTFSVGTEGSFDFTPTSNNWAANSFYKFTINVTNTSSTNYGLDVKSIVFYKENGGSSLTQSDLALTNAPVALNFDLYNNSSAQTISYTTSSTGAVTVSGGDGYVTTSVNATNKTITVTPTSVTPSAQTITVSQAADDYYNAGTATFTVSVTNSDPNVPGTQDNPYTVAQARAAIDAGVGVTGVYVTGIVCEGGSSLNSGAMNYWISDDGTETDKFEIYKGKGIDGANFTSTDDVQVGDVVVIYGNLKKYNSTYEFDANSQLVSLDRPVIPVISANNVELAYDATSGEIAYTISNPVESEVLTATCTANWISNITVDTEKVTFTTTANEGNEDREATITLSYTGAQDKTVTVTQKHFVADYATLPFEFDGGSSAIANTAGLTQEDLGSDYNSSPKLKFDSTGDYVILKINERPGVLTFDIKGNNFSGGTFTVQTSEDGETYTNLKAYTEISGTQNETFNNLGENVRYIKWIYTNKSSGNVALGNIKLEKYSDVVVPEEGDNYELFSGELVEGDYLIVYDGKAMNTTVTNDRLQYTEVTATDDVITTDNAAIVWHIAPSGEYWTIYNADADAYAASTGAKNKAQMLADGTDDKALWTVSGTETYEFVNKQNAANSVNATLRKNGTYGFACYSTETGGALSLYKKVEATPEYVTVSISAAGYATYVATDNVYFPEDVTAYIVSDVTASSIKLTEVLAVAKDVPVVVKATEGTYDLEVVTADDCDDVTENKLLVSDGTVSDNILVLANKSNGVGFYTWAGGNLPAGKVYLVNPNSSREFFGFDEGVATSISTIDNGQWTMDNAYNLQGQKVGSEYKGIIIVNGKKVMVK